MGIKSLLKRRPLRRRGRRVGTLAVLAAVLSFALSSCISATPGASWGTNTGPAVNVYATAHVGRLLIIGGNFTSVVSPDGRQTHAARGLAALDATTGAWVWSADVTGAVYRIAADGSTLWVGGAFGVKHFSTAGVDLGYKAPFWPGVVHALAVKTGHVYYAGSTAVVDSDKYGKLLWKAPVDGQVYGMALNAAGNRLIVGGFFCTIGGIGRPSVASLGVDGRVDRQFNPIGYTCGAYQIARGILDVQVAGNTAYLAGGGLLNQLLAVSATNGKLQWATPHGDGDIQSISVVPDDNAIFIGGHFDCLTGWFTWPCAGVRHRAAAYTLSGQLLPWTPVFTGGVWGVWSITADTSGVYAGGNFTSVNGVTHNKVAIFH